MTQHTGKPKGNPTVSIVIPAKNEEENIKNCLDAVFSQETGYRCEVIVIDSGSTDQTVAVTRKFPQVKLRQIRPEDFGHGKTRNLGAEISTGDYIVFLNADAVPADNRWLDSLLQPFGSVEKEEKEEKCAGVYSRHFPKQGCHLYMARDIYKSMPDTPAVLHHAKTPDFMIFSTVSCAIPRSILTKYPFDNEIDIAEDQEWARRVLAEGFTIHYEPQSRVYHSHNYTPRQLFEVKRRVGGAEKKFKTVFIAAVVGLVLMVGGIIVKSMGDLGYILFKTGSTASTEKISFSQKLEEIIIAIKARAAGFAGRYRGWLT